MKFYNGKETINFKNGTMTLMPEPTDKNQRITLEELQKAVLDTRNSPLPTKEELEKIQKHSNEARFGLYMTNDEAIELLSKGFQSLYKWDYETHSYHQYGVPADWKISTYCADMSQIVNCAGCGKELSFAFTYTSFELHTKTGFGYGICKECNEKEWERRKRGETKC